MKILIIGSGGFLGTKLTEILSQNHDVIGTDISQGHEIKLDATNPNQVMKIFEKYEPEIVIDTVALTSSVKCENNPELANKLNFMTAKNILEACKKYNVKMFFISSSYVFDGLKGNYTEDDLPSPKNTYARTKLLAEKEIATIPTSVILRVDLLYGYNNSYSPNGIIGQMISGKDISIGNPHQIRSPLFIDDLANSILQIIEKKQSGIFHVAGDEHITALDFLKKIKKHLELNNKISIIDEKKLSVKPLKDSSLNNKKIKNIYRKFYSINEALDSFSKQLK